MTNPTLSPTPVSADDFPELRWRGHWIWCEPPAQRSPFGPPQAAGGPRPEAHGLFRKTFSLAQVPARVPARITADSRYVLYCNGREVFRGPIRSQPRRAFYDLFDLAPYLLPGENTLAIYVKYYGTAKAFWMPAPPAALGQSGLVVFEANLGTEWLVTDETWKAHKSGAWSEDWKNTAQLNFLEEVLPIEVIDARLLPVGWQQPAFDDRAWGSASRHSSFRIGGPGSSHPPADPYGPLYPRPIAQLGGERLVPATVKVEILAGQVDAAISDPVRRLEATLNLSASPAPAAALPAAFHLQPGQSARISLDMGRIVMGQAQLALEVPAGAVLDLSFTEDPLKPPAGMFGGMHAGARYVARGSQDVFSLFEAYGFRYAYLLIHGAAGEARVGEFAVQEDVYPWQPGAEFACSDADLNAIFRAGIRTVQLNSRDAFTDCPTREQQAWVGDSVVHQMAHLVSNTDWRLCWQYLTVSNSPRDDGILPMTVVGRDEAANGQTIPDWSLHWVHGVYNLYRFLGDRAALMKLMPSVARVLRWFEPYQNRRGVLQHIPEWALIDWSAVSVSDESAIYTAIWARGLREFAEMAAWLGEQASREWAEAAYAKAQAGFEIFWDEARGSYVDHVVEGAQQPEMSQLAGALAIVAGLAPAERGRRIIDYITNPERVVVRTWMFTPDDPSGPPNPNRGRRFTWDTHTQVVKAEPFMSYVVHDAVAAAGLAERLPALCRAWSQFLQDGYDTIGEDWDHGTHVHGWSCTPNKDLVFYTLGVTPAEPGYAAARVAPVLGGLAWAEGKIPTPRGLLWVRAEPGKVEIDSPIPLVVELPGQPARRLPAGRHSVS